MPEPKIRKAKRSPPFKRGMLLRFVNPTSRALKGTFRMSRFSYDTKLCRITKVASGAVLYVKPEELESIRTEAKKQEKLRVTRADILAGNC